MFSPDWLDTLLSVLAYTDTNTRLNSYASNFPGNEKVFEIAP